MRVGNVYVVLKYVRLRRRAHSSYGESPCPHTLTHALKRVRQKFYLQSNLA